MLGLALSLLIGLLINHSLIICRTRYRHVRVCSPALRGKAAGMGHCGAGMGIVRWLKGTGQAYGRNLYQKLDY
jgi:hypothetical protein